MTFTTKIVRMLTVKMRTMGLTPFRPIDLDSPGPYPGLFLWSPGRSARNLPIRNMGLIHPGSAASTEMVSENLCPNAKAIGTG